MHVLNKLAFEQSHTFLANDIFRGQSQRLSAGHNHTLRLLDKRHGNLVNANSLGMWVGMFPEFAEAIKKK